MAALNSESLGFLFLTRGSHIEAMRLSIQSMTTFLGSLVERPFSDRGAVNLMYMEKGRGTSITINVVVCTYIDFQIGFSILP